MAKLHLVDAIVPDADRSSAFQVLALQEEPHAQRFGHSSSTPAIDGRFVATAVSTARAESFGIPREAYARSPRRCSCAFGFARIFESPDPEGDLAPAQLAPGEAREPLTRPTSIVSTGWACTPMHGAAHD